MESMELRYAKAFCEVKLIIDSLTNELYEQIPESFLQMINDNQDRNYLITIEDLKNKGLMNETKAVVSLIYRDFFCDDETRSRLINEDKLELQKEMDTYNQIFDKKIKPVINEEDKSNTLELTVVKELKWYQKLFNKIKLIFRK